MAGAYRAVGEHQVYLHDDNLLVRASWPDHEAGGPPDVVTHLRKVAERNLRVEVQWLGSGHQDPQHLQR
ncbi:hypothetical protein E1193_12605 [Micromonospora sp. KC606]|uniref:hypothetical protein n=1 Tax=Micromonospora sp. KC606 TaxID=2530379 RepID=UPI001048BC62|nr:hypothetical protein [Micromonospora sp. KC606]TDC82191.1 hypothetical protein E1193_12605 [Micromonospora sp. KC606]